MGDSKEIEKEIEEASHRIRLLESENKRAIKRVLETRKKISDIHKARERYLSDKEERAQLISMRAQSIDAMRGRINQERKEKKDKHFFIQYEILNIKQSVGKRGRELKNFVLRNKQQTDIEDKRRRKRLHEAVHLSKQQAEMRMKLLNDYKTRNFHNHYTRMIEHTDNVRTLHEKNVLSLARREQEMLERVNKAQDIQQNALNELENILNTTE